MYNRKSPVSVDRIMQPEFTKQRSISPNQSKQNILVVACENDSYLKEIDALSVQSIRLRNSPKTTVTQLSNYDLLRSRSSSLTELRSRSSSSLESSGARARLPSSNSSLEYFLNSPQSSIRTINSPSSNSNRVIEIPHQTMLSSHSHASPLAAQGVITSPSSRNPSVDVPVQKMPSSPNRHNNSSTTGHHSSNDIPTKKLPGTPPRIPDELIGKIGSHTTIYLVQFRHIIKDCVNKGPFNLKKGDFVMVQCDRGGQDMGVVVDVVSLGQYLADREAEIANSSSPLEPTTIDVISLPAIPEQIARLTQKNVDEENALSTIKNIVSASQLQMKITGVEFQFDRQKLTVYYTSNERIHFNDLVKTLFNAFKTRVWMKKTNQSRVFQERMWARVQLATGVKISHGDEQR